MEMPVKDNARRVLIIAGDPASRDRLQRMLRQCSPACDILFPGPETPGWEALAPGDGVVIDGVVLNKYEDWERVKRTIDVRELRLVVLATDYGTALRGFAAGALDCIHPADMQRLQGVLERTGILAASSGADAHGGVVHVMDWGGVRPIDRMIVRDGSRSVPIFTRDIYAVRANSQYCEVITQERSYELRRSITEVEQMLDGRYFLRVHRSHILNVLRMREHYPASHRDRIAVLQNGMEIRVSRRYVQGLLNVGVPG